MNGETVKEAMGKSAESQIRTINRKMPKSLLDDDAFPRLKIKINNLLWEELPGHICLTKAEEIACEIMTILINELPGTIEE